MIRCADWFGLPLIAGLVTKRLNSLEEALQAFRKLHRMTPKDSQVIFHIANL